MYREDRRRRWLYKPLALFALASPALAQTDPFDDNPIPDLFASLLTLSLANDISTASFRIDNGGNGVDDTRFSTLRIPWSATYDALGQSDGLYVEADVGVLWAEDGVTLASNSGPASVDEDWLVLGASLGVGWKFPLGAGWRARPGVSLTLGYLENKARYNAAGEAELAPIIEGTLVNWDAWSSITAASLTIEHPRDLERLDAGASARYLLARTSVFGATRSVQEGHDTSEFLVLRAEVGGPITYAHDNVNWDAFAGWAKFYDVDRASLGFDGFIEVGMGATFDAPAGLPRMRLGLAWITGDDVTGWSLGIAL